MHVTNENGTKYLNHKGERIALDPCGCTWLTMSGDDLAPAHGRHENECPTEESYFVAQDLLAPA